MAGAGAVLTGPSGRKKKRSRLRPDHCFLLSLALGLRSPLPHFLHLDAFLELVA